jgi:hypothetical protein
MEAKMNSLQCNIMQVFIHNLKPGEKEKIGGQTRMTAWYFGFMHDVYQGLSSVH